ncbi:MAG: winged helix DNA-binding protein, partial [Alphaproteobacteria bacterium]|nr:winged helix DNA-binding protein [Alphaproteobacteria bacterium]
DKVAVSRALRGLCHKGLIDRKISRRDRRCSILTVTAEGEKIYHQIEPLVTGYEKSLLAVLTPEELSELDHLLDKLTEQATARE